MRHISAQLAVAAPVMLLLLSGESAFPLDERKEPAWHAVDVWRQPQGLPQNSVNAVLQTRDGYIWIGTHGGLARFDGVRFTTFDNRNQQQLKENEIWALAEGDDSSLWIGTYGGGLSRLRGGQFTVYTTQDGLVSDYVTALCQDGESGIWIGTDYGLSRFKDERFTNYTVKEGLAHPAVRALFSDRDGNVWVGSNKGGLNRIKDDKIYEQAIEKLTPGSEIRSICVDRNHALWVASTDGLFRREGGRTTRYTTNEGLSSNRVVCLHEDPAGNLWVGTNSGLDRYKDGRFSSYRVGNEGSLKVHVAALCNDHEGSLWVGVYGEGLARLRQGQFISYTMPDGVAASTILQDKKGRIWIGTIKGLSLFSDGGLTAWDARHGLPGNLITSLGEDRAGNLWVGTEAGLYRSQYGRGCAGRKCDPQFTRLENPAIPDMHVRVIFEDREGTLWIGTNLEGLVRYKDNQFTTWTTRDGLSNNAIRGLCEDPGGSLWIGTRGGGLNRFKDGKFSAWTEKDGLAGDSIQALYPDPQNTLWIATRHGLSRFKDGRLTAYTTNDGLYFNFITSLVEDDKGNLWMSCSKGIFRVSKQQLNDFAEAKISSVTSVAYGLEHGLSSTVATGGFSPGAYKTSDGRVWFATTKGVSVVGPEPLTTNTLSPPVHIEEVSIDQHPFDLTQTVEAPPGRGEITIRYTALSFLAPEKVRFKYKLEGYDREWVDAGDRRAAYYNNIPPGRYGFRVKAANNDGVWNEAGAFLEIYLMPRFYQTRWFYALGAFFVVLSGVGAYRLRTRQSRAREHQLVRVVDERTKDLQAEVTARKQAEEALRLAQADLERRVHARTAELQHSEERYRALYEDNPSMYFTVDTDGVVLSVNKFGAQQLGYTAEELVGKPVLSVFYAEDIEAVRGELDACLRSPARIGHWVFRKVRKDGTVLWVKETARVVRDANGNSVVLIVCEDITERWRAEEALKTSEQRYRLLIETMTEGLLQIDAGGRIEFANEQFCRIVGYGLEELFGKHITTLLDEEGQAVLRERRHIRNQRVGGSYELQLETRAGERVWVEVSEAPVLDSGGGIGSVAICTDITQRKLAEEALRESEEKYRRFFDEDLSADFIATPDGQVLACNPAFVSLFGFGSVQEAMSYNLGSLDPTPGQWGRFVQSVREQKNLEYYESEFRRHDKRQLSVIANVVGVFGQNGELLEIRGYLFDNTEHKKLEQQFLQSQKMEAVGRLAGGVAHDFNNWLVPIIGYSQLLLRALRPEDPYKKELEEINRAGQRAAALAGQLLTFSRQEVLEPRVIDLNKIVIDMDKMLRRLIGEHIELVPRLDPALGKVKADPGQIEQVIMNLVVNARDAMVGGGKLTVETRNVRFVEQHGKQNLDAEPQACAMLAVSDTGSGMDAETQAHVFEPFFTTKETGKGTGLGLSTVYGIVKQSGGSIVVYSEMGQGTTMKVYFPLIGELPDAEARVGVAQIPRGSETVLLVEDEPMVREFVAAALRGQGYTVIEAGDASEALRIGKEHGEKIDLLLTDVVMPRMSGPELAREFLALRPESKVLYVSGYTGDAIVHHRILESGVPLLQKPFAPEALARKLREVLDHEWVK